MENNSVADDLNVWIVLCHKNQLAALFILSLFHPSTSTCFGHICSPSSGGILYTYNNRYVLCFLVDCLLAVTCTETLAKQNDNFVWLIQ